jgi:hypothetical protein
MAEILVLLVFSLALSGCVAECETSFVGTECNYGSAPIYVAPPVYVVPPFYFHPFFHR